jgi:LmbE family N-acetylglucosaminyl deacetylase
LGFTIVIYIKSIKMIRTVLSIALVFLVSILYAQNDTVRIIMIGAHPDDCDIKGGGTAAILASMGHSVKFVSVTNGDAGHHEQGGGILAKRRIAEAKEAGKRFGVEYEVMDNHDGGLLPTMEVRLELIRKIREWNADVVIAPRPNDYHPDHRYTGILVQDAAYMVGVPNVAADTPPLSKNPVFLYFQDNFQKPNPFSPDIAVDISSVYDQKIHALAAHESQVFEWLPWIGGYLETMPEDKNERKEWLKEVWGVDISPEVRTSLEKWYGKDAVANATNAEAFEICEYGKRPTDDDIRRLFPMLKK